MEGSVSTAQLLAMTLGDMKSRMDHKHTILNRIQLLTWETIGNSLEVLLILGQEQGGGTLKLLIKRKMTRQMLHKP